MTIASFVPALSDRWLGDLFRAWIVWSLKGTILLFLAWISTVALRRGSAAVRHLVWASALAGMLLLPAFARAVPAIHVGWLSELGSSVRVVVAAPTTVPVVHQGTAGVEASSVAPTLASVRPAAAPSLSVRELEFKVSNFGLPKVSVALLLAVFCIVVMALLILRAIAGVLQLSIWARRAEAVHDAEWLSLTQRLAREMQIARPVTLLQSDRACVPMTWGVVYPRILLPEDADAWTADRRTIVLLHELAHIKRLDTLTQLLAQLSTALFWFHPAVWFVAREMRREREHACDDFVLDAGARASDYAHSLLQIARPLVTGAPAAAALAMARKSELEGRLLAILDPRVDRRPTSRLRLALASVALVGLAIPLAAVSPTYGASRSLPSPSTVAGAVLTPPPHTAIIARALIPHSAPTPRANATKTAVAQVAPDSAKTAEAIGAPASAPTIPPPAVVGERPTWSRLNILVAVAKRTPPDIETLVAVTRAATKMTSDHDKAEVLLSVARHYVPNNELRSAYFDAVLSMHNDFERTRVLQPVLMKDTIPSSASSQLVRIAESMSADNTRGSLVSRVAADHPSMRAALIPVVGTLRSDYERSRAISAIARGGSLSADDELRLIAIAKIVSSSTDKANALLAIVGSRPLDTPELRRAYLNAAETITSPYDYRRAVMRIIE